MEAHVSALNNGTVAQIVETFASDAVFVSPVGTVVGRELLAAFFTSTIDMSDRPQMTICSHTFVDPTTIRVALARHFVVCDDDGEVIAEHTVDLAGTFTVSDGVIQRLVINPIES